MPSESRNIRKYVAQFFCRFSSLLDSACFTLWLEVTVVHRVEDHLCISFLCLPTVLQKVTEYFVFSPPVLQREPDREEQPDSNMPPKFKRHLNDDEVTGSIRSERVRTDGGKKMCLLQDSCLK